ncbi:MarR family transcriptional regulator [Alicyclobacillus ferrooxydans]|uniref:MarR family transcriptional regulator n=1 Tax=Alicyclobacillus ferrooxydans TaxID=471514 RepID=A0A0P9CU57_9BACL|nr:MarR family transcriptional regulator [Alicyclobacillus ferrooxydans]
MVVEASLPVHVVEIEQELRQIAGVVRRRGRSLLEQFGITPPQFDALVILDRAGDLTIGELSNRLYLAYSTTTDLVDRLERAGFVVRSRDTADRRVVLVKLQEKGKQVIERVLDARRAYLGVVLESLDESERLQILKVLNVLHDRMLGTE